MKVTITPSTLSGNIDASASKSSMQRACAMALLSNKKVIIHNPGHSNDDKVALDIIEKLGATVTQLDAETIEVESNFLSNPDNIVSKENEINCGESGLSIRMFTPIAALCKNKITITGEGSLLNRPIDFFDEILPQLGVHIQSNNGKLPMVIQGPLQPKDITINGSLSSQFLTGLLLAYSFSTSQREDLEIPVPNQLTISVKDLKSKPYIDLTLNVMKHFGLNVPVNNDYKEFTYTDSPFTTHHTPIVYNVEGDWSGGAFLLVAGAIAGNIRVSGLSLASTQADKKIVDALMSANAGIAMEAKGIVVHAAPMAAFEFDATHCPDLFPPLVALAAYCKGVTKIKGVSRLAHKESDRAITLQQEFAKMGLQIELDGDEMHIHGGNGLNGAVVQSRHDHRIAMACAVAALKAKGATVIEDAEAINKSYPDFYEHIRTLGGDMKGDKINVVEILKNMKFEE
jgi:3-phosphoshikimate 1-carboxyvinyltransferase